MSIQEAALYGDLVLHLRNKMAEMLIEAKAHSNLDEAHQYLDELIREWFFTPQKELHGSTPRDVIWREQLGQGNPVSPEHAHEMFHDDCPLCQAAAAEIEAGEPHHNHGGWYWTYCPDSGLIDLYDPEGSEARWLHERFLYQPQLDPAPSTTETPVYTPPAIEDMELSPEEFMERFNQQAQVDQQLKQTAAQLIQRFDCPISYNLFGTKYRHLRLNEGVALLKGLDEQGVDLDELIEQVEAWPYQNIALEWLSDPEQHLYLFIKGMETRLDPADKAELIRFRQHRDFHFILCQLIPYNARLWLQGWLEGLALGEKGEDLLQ